MLARVRSDAPHQTGARRRGGDACHPTDVAQILRLQRTIGNRATTRLLLRDPIETEHAQERARFDAAKRTHERNLVQFAELKPHRLKSAGIDGVARRQGHAAADPGRARGEPGPAPLPPRQVPGQAVTDGRFTIHSGEDDFNQARKRAANDQRQLTKDQRAAEYGDTAGWFDRTSKTVHVRARTKFGNALHEAMHKVAHPAFDGFWDEFINEGVTQLFTDELLKEQGLSEVTNHKYQAELACAKQLVSVTSRELVASAYFQTTSACARRSRAASR